MQFNIKPHLWLGLLGALSISSIAYAGNPALRIINGTNASTQTYPWMASLFVANTSGDSGSGCGASLIAPQWVLSAAHCFLNEAGNAVDSAALQRTTVTLRSDTIDSNTTTVADNAIERKVISGMIHPNYTPGAANFSNDFDIALLQLETPVTELSPVSLIDTGVAVPVGSTTTVMGWGAIRVENGQTVGDPPNLLQVEQKVVSNTECSNIYGSGMITDNMLCAGGFDSNDTRDSCKGDSGGPLVTKVGTRYVQIGVVSFGGTDIPCGDPSVPGVYTRVSQFKDFVQQNATGVKFATLAAASTSTTRLSNISVRCHVQANPKSTIAGFVIEGGSKKVLLRGLQVPSLSPDLDMQLSLNQFVNGQWQVIGDNDNWGDHARSSEMAALATHLVPRTASDAGLLMELEAGTYTVIGTPKTTTGIGIVGVDDLDEATTASRLTNISGRCNVEAGQGNAIAGFIIDGDTSLPALLRGMRTADDNLSGALNPSLELVRLNGGSTASALENNTNWGAHPRLGDIQALATHLLPRNTHDSAILRDLSAGVYTVLMKPSDNNTGIGVVGVDDLN